MKSKKNIAVIIIAAGASKRMGAPKQLLGWQDTTLLGHAIANANSSVASNTYLVLGANFQTIRDSITDIEITILKHRQWSKGLGSSIAFGVQNFAKDAYDGVLIMLADQPQVDNIYLNRLIHSFESNQEIIVATEYPNQKFGVPALFDKYYFEELSELNADFGAKKLIYKNRKKVRSVKPLQTLIDIDTLETYKALYNQLLLPTNTNQ